MATAGPSNPNGGFAGKGGPRARYQANLQKYGTPLPILLPSSPLHPAYSAQKDKNQQSYLSSVYASLNGVNRPIVPQCKGEYDAATRSVIVRDRTDMDILFRRGFFGKGTLSRSEPTWRERRLDVLKGGSGESDVLSKRCTELM